MLCGALSRQRCGEGAFELFCLNESPTFEPLTGTAMSSYLVKKTSQDVHDLFVTVPKLILMYLSTYERGIIAAEACVMEG